METKYHFCLGYCQNKKNRETLNTISKLYLLLFEYSRTTVFVNDYILALSSEDYFRSSFVSWPIVQREKEREKREMATTTYHSMINFCAPRLADSQQFAVNQRNTG